MSCCCYFLFVCCCCCCLGGGGGIVVIFAGLHLLASHYIGTIFASLPNFTSQFQPDLHGEWAMGGGGGGVSYITCREKTAWLSSAGTKK